MTATNAVGTGPASNALSATPTATATVPGAPTLTAATRGNATVALAWTAPASNGGSAITGYRATATPGGAVCTTTGGLGCTVVGLTNGTTYSFTVTATNAVGTGPASNALSATPATVPGAPTLTSATAGPNQVTLAWTAPASNGGSAITGYDIYRGSTSGAENFLRSVGNVTGWTDLSLTNGTTYFYQVRTVNANGAGTPSSERSATPIGPGIVPDAPQNLAVKPNMVNGVTLHLESTPDDRLLAHRWLQGLPKHGRRRRDVPHDSRCRPQLHRYGRQDRYDLLLRDQRR